MRGYGGTEAPEPIDQYTLFHMVGDMAELVKALGESKAVDRRPRLGRAGRLARRAVAARSASRRLRHERALRAAGLCRHPEPRSRSSASTTSTCNTSRSLACAEAELQQDIRGALRRLCFTRLAASSPRKGKGFARLIGGNAARPTPSIRRSLPAWLSDADLDYYYAGNFRAPAFAAG